MICHTCDHMFILKVHTFKSIHFLQSATNINVIFSLNFHQHCFYFILFYKIIVFSLILCCVVFFTCVCVSLCNVLFKCILVSICFDGVVMLLMLLQSFLCFEPKYYCENLTRGDEKFCKDKLLLHHNCFYYSCNGPYNLAMLVTMLLKLLLSS